MQTQEQVPKQTPDEQEIIKKAEAWRKEQADKYNKAMKEKKAEAWRKNKAMKEKMEMQNKKRIQNLRKQNPLVG